MKEQLNRQLGPFKMWQWLVVIIVGVGLGLLIRRKFAKDTGIGSGVKGDYSGLGAASNPDAGGLGSGVFYGTQGAPAQFNSPDFETVSALVEGQDRFADELDRLQGNFEENLLALQQQEADQDTWINKLFTDIVERIDTVMLPAEPKPISIMPVGEPVKLVVPDSPTPSTTTQAPTSKTYTVVKGDTLWKIATRFGYKHWQPIYDANRSIIGSNPDLIKPGQVLRLP